MKYLIILIVCLGAGFSLLFAEGKTLEDVTVKAELSLEVRSQKPPLIIDDFELNSILLPTIKTRLEKDAIRNVNVIDIKNSLPKYITSKKTIAAYLNNVLQGPFVVFNFRVKEDYEVGVDSWKLIINDTRGALFKELEEKGTLPDEIIWDGVSEDGELFMPGRWYSYNLEITDYESELHTIQGKTFKFPAIYYEERGGSAVVIATDEVFNQNAFKIKRNGYILLREVVDLIKRDMGTELTIKVFDADVNKADRKGKAIKAYLMAELLLDESNIIVESEAVYVSDYKIEINIR